MTVVVRRPGPPLDGLVTTITYRTGEQPRTSVEKILPGPETGLWVVAAAGALSRGVRVSEVSDRLGLLPRTLRRRFTAQVGLTPKRFARVQRLQRLVRGLDGQARVDWATTAARHGYCDQAHLADEFRELVGVTPAGYLRSRVNGPNHLQFRADDVRS
jgi:AraC-like DNA-binding protein